MTAQLAPNTIFRSWDNLGLPLVGGKLNTYIAGTTTPQATYTDSTQGTPNTNPVILNFRGEAFVWLDPALTYKFVLTDALNNLIWTEDNIQGGFTPSSISASLIPTPTNSLTLGSASNSWANAYFGPSNAPVFDPVSGNIGYYARTAAEIYASVTPSNYVYTPGGAGGSTLNVFRFMTAAQIASVIAEDGIVDHTAAIQAANNFLEARNVASAGGQVQPGGTLFFPCGLYNVNSTTSLRIGGHVRWLGDGHYGTCINVNDTTGTVPVVVLGPDQSGYFAFSGVYTMYSSIENFRFSLQPNNQRSYVIYSLNAQDGSYIKRVQLYNVNQYGIAIDQCGDMFAVDDIQMYAGTLEGLPLSRIGVRCGAGGVMTVRNFLIAGISSHNFVSGIRPRGGGMHISGGMFERTTDGVACLETDAPAQGNTITVQSVLGTGNVTNTVHIGSGFPSTVTCMDINGLSGTTGAPVAIKNDNTGENLGNSQVGVYSWSGPLTGVQASAFGYSALHNTPHIRYGKNATQAITQNTLTILTFPSKQDDWLVSSQSEWGTGTGAVASSRYTPKIPGRYRVSVSVSMASTTWAAGNRLVIQLQRTGASFSQVEDDTAVGSFIRQITITDTILCGSGDYIEAYVFQGVVASLNTDNTAFTCFIAIDRE